MGAGDGKKTMKANRTLRVRALRNCHGRFAAGAHLAIRPPGPAAQPAVADANATLLYATVSTIVQLSPPLLDVAVPASPTATNERPLVPGMNATPDMYPRGDGPLARRHVFPPSAVTATLSNAAFGLVYSP